MAEIVFGIENPSAKLPISFPRSADQLHPFVHDRDEVGYDYFHGYHLLDRNAQEPQFPFGFGLSYTTFSYGRSDARFDARRGVTARVRASVEVTNSGQRSGTKSCSSTPARRARASSARRASFGALPACRSSPGKPQACALEFPAKDLAYWDEASAGWVVEPISYTIAVGASSRNLPATATLEVVR